MSIKNVVSGVSLGLLSAVLASCSGGSYNPPATGDYFFNGPVESRQVDDFGGKNGKVQAVGVVSDDGNVAIVAGTEILDDSSEMTVIRRSTDGQALTWTTINESKGPDQEGARSTAIARGADGNVYVAQQYASHGLKKANIHYSTDNGDTWKDFPVTLDNSRIEAIKSIFVGAGSGPHGILYMVGSSETKDKKTNTAFVLASEEFKPPVVILRRDDAHFQALSQTKTGDLIVAGDIQNKWLVTKISFSKDESKPSITTRDNHDEFPAILDSAAQSTKIQRAFTAFQLKKQPSFPELKKKFDLGDYPTLTGAARSVIVTSRDRVYVAGTVSINNKIQSSAMAIRQSFDNGETFSTKEIFLPDESLSAIPVSLQTFNGRPLVLGRENTVEGKYQWIVRYSLDLRTDDRTGWQPLYGLRASSESSEPAAAVGATAFHFGTTLLVVGETHDSKAGRHWVVQRFRQAVPPPR